MHAHEMFYPHPFETGPAHHGHGFVFERRGRDRVIHSAADPDRDVEKIRARLVVVVALTHFIFIHPSEEKSADIYRASLGQHRAENAASLRAAGKSGERDRPITA